MPVIPASEQILLKMQEEEAELERTKDERAHKKRLADEKSRKLAVMEKSRADAAKEELNDQDKMFKACEIGDSEGVYLLIRKLQRQEEGSLLDAGGIQNLVDATTPDGATPLYFACKNGAIECCRILLRSGANPGLSTRAGGFTPLWIACAKGKREPAALMLQQPGMVVDQRAKDGRTPLYAACEGGEARVVQMLLDKRADVEARRSDMSTPLIVAAVFGHAEVVSTLLDAGALLKPRDEDGTALDNAKKSKKPSCVALLEEAMRTRGGLEIDDVGSTGDAAIVTSL